MAGLLERAFNSGPGQAVAGRLGLPEPPRLRRGTEPPDGPVVVGSLAGSGLVTDTLGLLGIVPAEPLLDDGADTPPAYPERIGAILIDARGLVTIEGLEHLRAVLR
ncbi:MAG: short chain dehydrogenase, partial [Propionibacteriaceae bacterium]|nr:short chain dehydrogenase [Propionibacteriaceae bacterium]